MNENSVLQTESFNFFPNFPSLQKFCSILERLRQSL